jgi:myo-inositol-1(or 4)-monophosphatase
LWLNPHTVQLAKLQENQLTDRKAAAQIAAREAGKIILEKLGRIKIDYKSAFNLVTDADKAAEAKILEILTGQFPEDEVLAEESGENMGAKGKSRRRWLIDPLDGTTNFAHAYPFFCVSIALVENDKRVLGVVYNPTSNEMFLAEAGKGAWLNDERIQVSPITNLEESLLATGFPPSSSNAIENNMEQFKYLTGISHGVRRDGAAALDLCYVACGRLDGFWEQNLAPWDIGAGSLIVEEAGGKISDLKGATLNLEEGNIVATNQLIHEEVIESLQKIKIAR